MPNSRTINWLFGRGLSVACGLSWLVPKDWGRIEREERIALIKGRLREEMDLPIVNCRPIKALLDLLASETLGGWRHRLITTNWDYLIQREVLALNLSVLPSWLANSHVFHLNGSVEPLGDDSNRSPFLLEEDAGTVRVSTPEANIVYNQMIWDRYFVVVGMSFECQTDRFLLRALARVEDDMPIGESSWLVVNRDHAALRKSVALIQESLPNAAVDGVCASVTDWLECQAKQQLERW